MKILNRMYGLVVVSKGRDKQGPYLQIRIYIDPTTQDVKNPKKTK
jgi:hypothetical protein